MPWQHKQEFTHSSRQIHNWCEIKILLEWDDVSPCISNPILFSIAGEESVAGDRLSNARVLGMHLKNW